MYPINNITGHAVNLYVQCGEPAADGNRNGNGQYNLYRNEYICL